MLSFSGGGQGTNLSTPTIATMDPLMPWTIRSTRINGLRSLALTRTSHQSKASLLTRTGSKKQEVGSQMIGILEWLSNNSPMPFCVCFIALHSHVLLFIFTLCSSWQTSLSPNIKTTQPSPPCSAFSSQQPSHLSALALQTHVILTHYC